MPTLTPENVVAEFRTLLRDGVLWRHQGRDPRAGLDCAGSIFYVLRACGWTPKTPAPGSYRNYPRAATDDTLARILDGECERIESSELRAGDFVLFECIGRDYPQHLVMVSEMRATYLISDYPQDVERPPVLTVPYIIHSSADKKKVVEHGLPPEWEQRIAGCWRLREWT